MERTGLIRDYENAGLPIAQRVASLARRFPCLGRAPGLDPFEPAVLYEWVASLDAESQARHAGLLILNLLRKGPWPVFDAVSAIAVFDDENRMVFANWVRCWRCVDNKGPGQASAGGMRFGVSLS